MLIRWRVAKCARPADGAAAALCLGTGLRHGSLCGVWAPTALELSFWPRAGPRPEEGWGAGQLPAGLGPEWSSCRPRSLPFSRTQARWPHAASTVSPQAPRGPEQQGRFHR